MCGLYGVYSPSLNDTHRDMFEELSYLSLSRGLDSTGLGVVRESKTKKGKKHTTWWYKTIDNAARLLRRTTTRDAINHPNNILLMGHNRAATIGKSDSAKAAHPYEYDHILGCHNGTIRDHKFKPDETYLTDSSRLFHMISQDGLEKAGQEVFNGVFALSYIDKSTYTFNLVKNTHMRDVYMMWSKSGCTFVWASEEEFLDEIQELYPKLEWDKIAELTIDKLYSINYKTGTDDYEDVKFTRPFRSVGGTSTHGVGANDHNHWHRNNSNHVKKKTIHLPPPGGTSKGTKTTIENAKDGSITLSYEAYPDICIEHNSDTYAVEVTYSNGLIVPIRVYERMLHKGCGWCGDTAELEDHVIWLDAAQYIHHDCNEDPMLQHMMYGKAI